ncbi:hypothetical protein KKE45_01640 [Patescibacteria group bacterium]|nr:hypothetical protein [Patescibacteria group bacterium]
MKGKYYKKPKKNPHNYHFRVILIITIGLFIAIVLAIKQALSPPLFPLFHGPHLSQALYKAGINEAEVLGSKSKRSASRSKPKPTSTRKPKRGGNLSTPTSTATPSPTSIPTPTVSPTLNQLGIAAGGDLPYLGQSDLDIYFSQLKELGISWLRYDFEWRLIQTNGPSDFDWSGTDRVVQTASKYGIKTLGTITYTPTWAQSPACKGNFACAPADPNAFGLFAGQVTARYAPQGIHHWEIWNEPNYHGFWKPAPNVSSYVAILKSAYTNIKKVDPSAFILSGGLASAGDEDNNIAPITFIRALYKLNTTKDFDAVAIHPYTYPALPSYPASWNSWQQIDSIRQLMIDHGDGNKPLWITEYGAPTSGSGNSHDITQLDNFAWGSDYMTENAQEMMITDVLSLFSQIKGPTGPFFWYSLHDNGTSKDTPENFFGLLRNDWSKKPAYDTFRNAILSK